MQRGGHGKAVDDTGFAAFDRILDAGQDLQRRHRVAVGIVGVRLQAEIGIGEIVGIDLGAHLEPAPVIGLPDVAEEIGHLAQRAGFGRQTVHDGEAKASHGCQPLPQDIAVAAGFRIGRTR